MIMALDSFIRIRLAQPAVDALQIDPDRWATSAARAASSAFVISCLGVAGIFAVGGMPQNSLWTIILGAAHVYSVRSDVSYVAMRRMMRDEFMPALARVMQLVEIVALLAFLAFVIPYRSALWTSLVAVFLAGVVISTAVAYVSVCDRPPPPRRRTSGRHSHVGA